MVRKSPYVIVTCHDNLGDPDTQNNYRPELEIPNENLTLLLDTGEYSANDGCMPRFEANELAKKIASQLRIRADLSV